MNRAEAAGRNIVAGVTGLVLAGCTAVSPPGPPSPMLAANAMGETAAQQHAVIEAMRNSISPAPSGYSDLAVAAFNVIDQKCDVYLSGLYQVEKSSKTAGSVLTTTQTATQAVLHDFGVGGLTIDILAQVFGVASAFNDVAAKAYLLTIGSSNVAATVSGLQSAYRAKFAEGAADIRSEPAVVFHLQSYLRLCSPVYIEAYIGKYIAGAKATPEAPTVAESFGVAPSGRGDAPITLTLMSGL